MFQGHPPAAYTVIDVATIRATMQAVEDELERDAPAGAMATKRRRAPLVRG